MTGSKRPTRPLSQFFESSLRLVHAFLWASRNILLLTTQIVSIGHKSMTFRHPHVKKISKKISKKEKKKTGFALFERFFVSRSGFLRRQLCSAVYLGCACTVPDVRIPADSKKKVLIFSCHSLGENVVYCARALSSSYTTGCTAARVSAFLLQARLSGTQSAAIGACASLACIDCCCFGAALTFVSMLCRLEKKRPLLFV